MQDYTGTNGHISAAKTAAPASRHSGLNGSSIGLNGSYKSGLATPISAATPGTTPRSTGSEASACL